MNNAEQRFLNELDNKFWKAADKLRANMDTANYKHMVLGLIFLMYVFDAFEARQQELVTLFRDIGNLNKALAQIRDTLLPRLLSGEITLPGTEQAVSEAENV